MKMINFLFKKIGSSFNDVSETFYIKGCSWHSSNWSCAYDSVIMGVYSLYNNLCTNSWIIWTLQSSLTHFLAEGFNRLKSNQSTSDKSEFNNLHDSFRDKLSSTDSNKFPRFDPCSVANDVIISALCDDNSIGQRMICLSFENTFSTLF